MIRAHKIRLNPTPDQIGYFRKAAGTKRFVYNWALTQWQQAKAQGRAEYGMRAAKKDFNALKAEQFLPRLRRRRAPCALPVGL
jgi:putative transposase